MWDWLAPALQAGSAIYGAYSANQAGQTAANAGNNALALQGNIYNQNRADSAPWRAAGAQVLPGLVGATQGGFQQSPGYQFQVDEAMRLNNNRLAAVGLTNSGAAQRATMQLAQGLAAQDYGNWFNRAASVAGLGQAAQAQQGALGANYANNAGGVMQNIGSALASGQTQGANALLGGANNLAAWWMQNQKPAGYGYSGGSGAPSGGSYYG